MLDWIIVVFIIVLGISLVVAEIIFVPGTTIVGALGVGLTAFGVYQGFVSFGTNTGIIILVITIIVGAVVTILSFRSGVWNRFALKTSIDSRVNDEHLMELEIGEVGIAVSALRPFGKGDFGGKEYEVQTIGDYVDSGTRLKIISVKGRKVFVEPINN